MPKELDDRFGAIDQPANATLLARKQPRFRWRIIPATALVLPALPVATVGFVGVCLTAFDVLTHDIYSYGNNFLVVLFQWLTAVLMVATGVLCWREKWRWAAIVACMACASLASSFLIDAFWREIAWYWYSF